MSMGQQLGSQTKPGATAGMTPSAGNMALPGQMPGRPPQNQLQQAMMPQGLGPVAPQPLAGVRSSTGQFKPGLSAPVAPQGGPGSITGLRLDAGTLGGIQNQQAARNIQRQSRGGGY